MGEAAVTAVQKLCMMMVGISRGVGSKITIGSRGCGDDVGGSARGRRRDNGRGG
jgi:hypothetical protein